MSLNRMRDTLCPSTCYQRMSLKTAGNPAGHENNEQLQQAEREGEAETEEEAEKDVTPAVWLGTPSAPVLEFSCFHPCFPFPCQMLQSYYFVLTHWPTWEPLPRLSLESVSSGVPSSENKRRMH